MYSDSRLQSRRVPWPHWPQPTLHPIPIITGINKYFSLYLWDLQEYSERNKQHILKLPIKPNPKFDSSLSSLNCYSSYCLQELIVCIELIMDTQYLCNLARFQNLIIFSPVHITRCQGFFSWVFFFLSFLTYATSREFLLLNGLLLGIVMLGWGRLW